MYAVGLAAFRWYHLITATQAFVLLVLASLLGVFVALRSKLAFVGVLAIVGAYLAPILLSTGQLSPVAMPLYMLALLSLGLALSAVRPVPFRALRYVVLLGTIALGSGWVYATSRAYPYHVLAFLALAWGAMHAELVLGSRRVSEAVGVGPRETSGGLARRLASPLLISFGATAWSVGLGVLALQETRVAGAMPAWMVPAAGLVATLVLAHVLAGHLRVMIDSPATDHERLAAALAMQSGGLLIGTVALALSDSAQAATWLGMGVCAIAAGRWLKARALDVYGLIVVTIGAGRLIVYDSWRLSGAGVPTALGFAFSQWSLLMVCAGGAWIGASTLLGRKDSGHARSMTVSAALGLGLTYLWGAGVSQHSLASSLILSAGVLCVAVMSAAWWRRSSGLLAYAIIILVACVLGWTWQYPVEDYDRFQSSPFLHPGFLVGVALVALALVASGVLARTEWGVAPAVRGLLAFQAAIASVLLLTASSFEVARSATLLVPTDKTVQAAAVSVWWGIFAVAGLAIGFARGWATVRHVALGLLGLGMGKAVLVDLAEVRVEWRIVSFLALGLLMLGVAIAYARVTGADRHDRDAPASSDDASSSTSESGSPHPGPGDSRL